jgi:hypothetical protein
MFRLEGIIIRLFVEPYRRYIKYSAHFGIPKCLQAQSLTRYQNLRTQIMKCCANIYFNVNFLGSQNVHCTWYTYDMVQRIAWWWLLRVETCRCMHNLSIINRCVWLKLYILSISNRFQLPVTKPASQMLHWTHQKRYLTPLLISDYQVSYTFKHMLKAIILHESGC